MTAANLGQFEEVSRELVGPVIGADLQRKGIYATIASIVGITIYIALRFRFSFAVGAIAATLHDILVTLAFLVFFGYDLSLNVIAAMLTITGYSVNDTIVIFDRVRENQHLLRREPLEKIVNDSVNQTLGRTIITAGTTFLAVLSLYLFGGEVLEASPSRCWSASSAAPTRRSSSRPPWPSCSASARPPAPRRRPSRRRTARGRKARRIRSTRPTPRARGRVAIDRWPCRSSSRRCSAPFRASPSSCPISSSAHLLLGRALLGWDDEPFGLVFDVATHLGTLAAVLVYFRDDMLPHGRARCPRLFDRHARRRGCIRLIVIGTIPAVIVGAAVRRLDRGAPPPADRHGDHADPRRASPAARRAPRPAHA